MRACFGLALGAALAAGGAGAEPLRVVATTPDAAALTTAVGGNLVAVEMLVPSAADPEAFEPRPRDIDRLRRAELVVRIGLGYDFWLDPLLAEIGERKLMRGGEAHADLSAGIPLLEVRGQGVLEPGGHAHGMANPHYWLDPQNAVVASAGIAEALVRLLPGERDALLAARDRFVAKLRERERRWEERLAPFAASKLIAYHNSWPYFARRFRLDLVGFIEPRPGVAPSPAHLARLIAEGRRASVRAVLHEPYEPTDAAQFLAGKLEVPWVTLATSVGSLPGVNDYFDLFETNVTALAAALGTPGR